MDFRTFITECLKPDDGASTWHPGERPKTIHLELALVQASHNLQDLKKALIQIQGKLAGLSLDRRTIMTGEWESLSASVKELALESIHQFFKGLIQLKKQPTFLDLIDIKQVDRNLKRRVSELDQTISGLIRFGYFEDNAVDDDINLLERKNVLIVEDMSYNRILLKKILERYKCNTTEAINGQEAIHRLEQNGSYDLVIMDMNMPVLDGFEATRSIRRLEKEKQLKRTPIVALTALAMRGDREKCLEAGCDEYMTKPVETNVLIAKCRHLLSGSTVEAEPDVQRSMDIQKLVLKTDNEIYDFILTKVLRSLGIEVQRSHDLGEIQKSLLEDHIDFMILEADTDLGLAYHIKNHYPDKHVVLITTDSHKDSILSAQSENNIHYPFSREEIISVLQHCSKMQLLARKQAENIADANSLGKIKGQASIKEAVEKSNHQLAVWQKAFRKIGGDLVLSHQFNMHGKYGFILGDVSGHDIQSGYTASWFAGLVKGVWGQNSQPFDLLRYLNSFLDHEAEEEDKRFVCALVLLWDPLRKKLSFANAGIPGGILVKKSTGKSTLIKWTGIPIGMFPEMDMFDHDEIDFEHGDRLYVATDGVLEAIPSEIISGMGETKSDEPPQQALESIVDFVTRSIEVTDDLTIAVFEGHHLKEPESGFRRTINSTNSEIESVLRQIEEYLSAGHFCGYDTVKILIATREALINSLEHGNGNTADKPIDIDLELLEKSLQIRISDTGGGFDLLSERKSQEEEGDLRIHGRGIEVMENICKSLSYTGGGVCLEFEQRHNPEKPVL